VRLRGSFDDECLGALGGLAWFILLKVLGGGALAEASLSMVAEWAETMVDSEM